MKQIVAVMVAMMLLFAAPIGAMAGPSDTFVMYSPSQDPCLNPSTLKSSVAVDTLASSATVTTSLVAATAAKSIYVCGFSATVVGTSPTLQFVSGATTTTACDTGPIVNNTGAFAPSSGANVRMNGSGTVFKNASGKALCSIATGTTTVKGILSYVKQ